LVAFAAAGFILFPPEHTCPPGFRLDRSVSPYRCLEMAGLHRSLPVKVDWPEGLFLMVGLGVVAGLVVLILGVVEAPLWGPLGLGRHRE
ncbi:MAG TPA: hypothetical protein VGR13_09560, partial [Actinomycetota bacterium]|nr:hypothetical protein [Actinomycetota bacterium]